MTWVARAELSPRSGQPSGTQSRRRGDERFSEPDGFRLVSLSRRDGAGRRQHPPFRRRSIQLARAVEPRSEEHTSELQSLMRISYAVFCLKKKTKYLKSYNQNSRTTTIIQQQ